MEWYLPSAFAVVALIALVLIPHLQVWRLKDLDSDKRFSLINEARKTLATILGGAVLLAGGYFTWQNVKVQQDSLKASQESAQNALSVARQGQITERFAKAVEQLGAVDASGKPKLEVRLGAIYSLEAIAEESESFYLPIVEVLSTYIRVNAPAAQEESPAKTASHVPEESQNEPASAKEQHPRADIQAILTVLGRRDRKYERTDHPVDLFRTDLRGANFRLARLEGIDLTEAHLEKANFFKAHLDGSFLVAAHLDSAALYGATLRGAHLQFADLYGAFLSGSDLSGADLRGTNLERANLGRVRLPLTDSIELKLGAVDLSSAKNLTQEQVNRAYGDAETNLPKGLCLPRSWNGVKADTPGACPSP